MKTLARVLAWIVVFVAVFAGSLVVALVIGVPADYLLERFLTSLPEPWLYAVAVAMCCGAAFYKGWDVGQTRERRRWSRRYPDDPNAEDL